MADVLSFNGFIPASIKKEDSPFPFDFKEFKDRAVNVKWFGAKGDGVTDDTAAIQAAIDAANTARGGVVFFPHGIYKITSSIVINTAKIILIGSGYTVNSDTASRAATVILKSGNFDGIVLAVAGAGVSNLQVDGDIGNGGDGIVIKQGRIFIDNVAVTNQGNDGIRVGDDAGASCNLWRMHNIICISNRRHGVYVHDGLNPTLPDTNAGLLVGLDSRSNGGDGLCIEGSIDNLILGATCQQNTGIGVHLKANAKGHQFYGMYTELNTGGECVLDSGSDKNIIWGYRSGENADKIVNNGAGNLILGRDNQIANFPPFVKSALAFKDLIIENETLSGYYEFTEDATNRNLNILFQGSSVTPVRAIFKHNNAGKLILQVQGLDIGENATSYPIMGHLRKEVTLDFPSIPANSTLEVSTTLTGVKLRDTVVATPEALESGLIWNAYISAADTITLRIANVTTAAINPAARVWNFDVWQR